MDRFAEKIGAGSISFNENRLCSFAIDEIYYISLSDANDEYMMILWRLWFPTDNPNFAFCDLAVASLWFAGRWTIPVFMNRSTIAVASVTVFRSMMLHLKNLRMK